MNFDPFIEWLKVNLLGPIQQLPVYPPNVAEGYSALLGAKSPGQMYKSAAKDVMLNTLNSYADWISNPMSLSKPMSIPGGMAGIMAGPKAKGYASAMKKGRVFASTMDRAERFEISDKAMKFKTPPKGGTNLLNLKFRPELNFAGVSNPQIVGTIDDFIDHPLLFKNYPFLKKVPLLFDDAMYPGTAMTADFRVGGAWYGKLPYQGICISTVKSKRELLEMLAHEIQHMIQDFENRSRGGVAEVFLRGNPRYETLARKYNTGFLMGKELDEWADIHSRAFKAYEKIFGEMEARDTAARRTMTVGKRKITPPYTSKTVKDIPFDEITLVLPETKNYASSNLLGAKK